MRVARFSSIIALGGALLAGAAAANETTAPGTTDDQRIICKKTLETGSLVRKTKQCFTKAEWDRVAETQRRGNEKLVDGLSTRSVSN